MGKSSNRLGGNILAYIRAIRNVVLKYFRFNFQLIFFKRLDEVVRDSTPYFFKTIKPVRGHVGGAEQAGLLSGGTAVEIAAAGAVSERGEQLSLGKRVVQLRGQVAEMNEWSMAGNWR